MITVPQKVEEIVKKTPFLEEALARDIVNLSQLARDIEPQLEQELIKDVSIASIVMALKRLKKSMPNKRIDMNVRKMIKEVVIRSDLMEFTFANSDDLDIILRELSKNLPAEAYLNTTKGTFESTVIVSDEYEEMVEKLFGKEKQEKKISGLSALSITLTQENLKAVGVYYYLLKLLAWNGIIITEVVSTTNEVILIMKDDQIDDAFRIIKNT